MKEHLLSELRNIANRYELSLPHDLDHRSVSELQTLHNTYMRMLHDYNLEKQQIDTNDLDTEEQSLKTQRENIEKKPYPPFPTLPPDFGIGQVVRQQAARDKYNKSIAAERASRKKQIDSIDDQIKNIETQRNDRIKASHSRNPEILQKYQEKYFGKSDEAVPTNLMETVAHLERAVHDPNSSSHAELSHVAKERGHPFHNNSSSSSASSFEHPYYINPSHDAAADIGSEAASAYENQRLTGEPGTPGAGLHYIDPSNNYPRETHINPPAKEPHKIAVKLPNIPENMSAPDLQYGPKWRQEAEKAAMEAAFHHYNNPLDEERQGPHVAPLSQEEMYAQHQRQTELNPWAPHNKREEQKIYNRLEELPSGRSEEVSEPYLQQLRRNPLEMANELKSQEGKDYLKSLGEEIDEDFLNNLLPRASERLSTIPGMRHHGAINKNIENLIEAHGKGKTRALTKAALDERNLLLNAAQKHQNLQLSGANTAAANAGQNFGEEHKKVATLAEQRRKDQQQKEHHLQYMQAYGEKKRGINQELIDVANKAHAKRQAQPSEKLQELMSNIRSIPYATIARHEALATPQHPMHNQPNLHQQAGAGLMGMGAGQMKKGGIVKRAAGGEVLQEALNNAVMHRDDPLYELRRLMDVQRSKDVYETKIGRRRFKSGGAVSDPIREGAQEARLFAAQNKYRDVLHKQQNTQKPHVLKSMMDDFMTGVASVGGDYGLGPAAKAYNSIKESHAAASAARDARELGAHQAEYGLEKDISAELGHLRKHALEREKLVEMKRHHMAAESLRNVHAEAPTKLSKEDQLVLKDAAHQVKSAPSLISKLKRVKELSSKINAGGWTSEGKLSSPRMQEAMGLATQADIDMFDKLTNQIALEASAGKFGSKAGARIVALMQQAKPHRGMSKEGIDAVVDEMIDTINQETELNTDLLSQEGKESTPMGKLASYAKENILGESSKPKEFKHPTQMTIEEIREELGA